MKLRLLCIITIILAVLFSSKVKAASYSGYIYEAEKIPNVYYYKHREDTADIKYEYHNFHSQAAIHRRSSDNAIVYCIESWKGLTGSNVGDFQEENSYSKLSPSQLDRIKKLAYFGYGYQDQFYNHTDLKWYAITQYMIWQVQAPNIEHYFVNSISSSTPINMFEREIAELNYLVDSLPNPMRVSYNESILLGKSKTIKIDNLKNYEISYSDNLAVETNLDNNTVKITPKSASNAYVNFKKKYNRQGEVFHYYVSDNYQDTMSVGDLESEEIKYEINIETTSIEIMPYEENKETNERTILTNYMYGLFAKEDIYLNDELIFSKDSAIASSNFENGAVRFNALSAGKYYVKELFYMGEYYDDKKVVDITIDDNNVVRKNLYYHRQKLKINLKKYLSTPIIKDKDIYYSLMTKEGIKFGLFNEQGDLVAEETSNSTGDIVFDLSIPYGNYYVKETSTLNNYYLSDFVLPITFERKGNSEYQIIGDVFEVINYPKTGTITVTKIDEDTKKTLAGVTFAIMNGKGEIVKEVITDNQGKISVTLPYGKYFLQELKTLDNYELNDKLIPFSITREFQNMEVSNKLQSIVEEPIENIEKGNLVDNLEVLKPNLDYEPIEVKLSKTDDENFTAIIFYLISSVGLVLFNHVKKSTI